MLDVIEVDASKPGGLTNQIVSEIRSQVETRELRPGTRLPSIREFASARGVSTFTVIQAYDRLVASGHVTAQQGVGFFVGSPDLPPPARERLQLDEAPDVLWLLRRQAYELPLKHLPGYGWPPDPWLEKSGIASAFRKVSRSGLRGFLGRYDNPRGFAALRTTVTRLLAEIAIDASADQVLLTSGATGAFDLVVRLLARPGGAVLVDDPGCFQTFGQLRSLGATLHGVPWTSAGPDLTQLERMARTHSPRLFFTSPVVQRPTGRSMSRGVAHRVLQLAERYDFLVVEDDIFGFLHPNPPPRIASLDELNRVIYVNTFSAVLSPRIRVGYLAAHRDLVRDLVDLKMKIRATPPEFNERVVREVLVQGRYRKHLAELRATVRRDRERALRCLEPMGLGPAEDGAQGLFAWLHVPEVADTASLAEAALAYRMLLAPGALFSPAAKPSSKMRFNVAFCQEDETIRLLETVVNAANER